MKGFKKESKEELRTSFRRAKKSTASLGNFDKQVEGEKKEKIGGKRKYDSLFNKNEKVIFAKTSLFFGSSLNKKNRFIELTYVFRQIKCRYWI